MENLKELFRMLVVALLAGIVMTVGALYWQGKAQAHELCPDGECMATCYERNEVTLHGLVKNVHYRGDVLVMENAVSGGWFKLTNPRCRFEDTTYAFPKRRVN